MTATMSDLTTLRESINTKLLALEANLAATNTPHPHLLSPTPYALLDDPTNLPSPDLFNLLSALQLDLTALTTLLTPTRFALINQGMLPYKTACLHTAVTLDVASAITTLSSSDSNGSHAGKSGVPLARLAAHCNVNAHKLGRVLRVLADDFIFVETAPDVFANTRHSIALSVPAGVAADAAIANSTAPTSNVSSGGTSNASATTSARGARSFLGFIGSLGMRCASGISADLVSSDTRDSFAEATAPFSRVGVAGKGDGRTFAQVMADPDDQTMVELGGEGVVGWLNQLTRESLLSDYPWEELGEGVTVVDLGAGMGDSGVDVLRRYPGWRVRWVYQDLGPVIEMLRTNFPADLQHKVADGTVSFVQQDYFEPNATDAQVWYMRGVLHEYDDPQALHLLSNITTAMRRTPNAKLLINEVLNSSPAIIPASSAKGSPPSAHVPDPQSALPATANLMTWSTFSLFGGKERSYAEYKTLLERAGLRVVRVVGFRTFTVMLEAELAE